MVLTQRGLFWPVVLLCTAVPMGGGAAVLVGRVAEGQVPDRSSAPPWLHSYGTPARTRYVAPDGTGDGASPQKAMGLAAAVESSQAGDLHWLLAGVYKGSFVLNKDGTKVRPIVFRASPGQRATIEGQVVVLGAHNWVWGLEVTDPTAGEPLGPSGSLHAGAPGAHLINNLVHDTWHCGIGGWQKGPDHVYYGNIIWKVGQHKNEGSRCYPIYTQSDFANDGYKYIVANMFLDALTDVGGPGFNFHAYTQRGMLTGFHIEKNVSRDGYFLLGGSGRPETRERVIENYFYKSSPTLGYHRPCQAEFRDNYLGRAGIYAKQFYGQNMGEVPKEDAKPAANVVTGNTVVLPDGLHVMVLTGGFSAGVRVEGTPRLDPADTFDGNTYFGPFQGFLRANGQDLTAFDLAAWQTGSGGVGNTFDGKSRAISETPPDKIAVIPNEYEPGRAHLVIYNWSKSVSLDADLSAAVAAGSQFEVLNAKDPYGVAAVSGTYQGPVAVPLGGKEMEVFLILSRP